MFLFNIIVFGFKKKQVEKHQFLVKRGVATKRVFLWTCVLQNVKSYRFFGAIFLANFGWSSKNAIEIGISALFKKQKNGKNDHFQSQ